MHTLTQHGWHKKTQQKLKGKGILSSVADTGAELFISKGIPFLAQKGLEAASYYASEFMRDPELQKSNKLYKQKTDF